jgi:hypothetical protein
LEQATTELNLAGNTQIFPKRYNEILLESIRENSEPKEDQDSTLEQIDKENPSKLSSIIIDDIEKRRQENVDNEKQDDNKSDEEYKDKDEYEEEEKDSLKILQRPNISIKKSIPIQNSSLNDSNNNIAQNYLNDEPPPRLSQLTFKSNSNELPKYSSDKFKPTTNIQNNEDQNAEE